MSAGVRVAGRIVVPGDVITAHLAGEAILLDMRSESYFRLNATAAAAWKAIERGRDLDEAVDDLCRDFAVEAGEARAQLDRLVNELERRGLIVLTDPCDP
jgi:hypothetical protein